MEKKGKNDKKKEGMEHIGSCCSPDMAKKMRSCCNPEMIERMKAFMESDDFKKRMKSFCGVSGPCTPNSKDSDEDTAAT